MVRCRLAILALPPSPSSDAACPRRHPSPPSAFISVQSPHKPSPSHTATARSCRWTTPLDNSFQCCCTMVIQYASQRESQASINSSFYLSVVNYVLNPLQGTVADWGRTQTSLAYLLQEWQVSAALHSRGLSFPLVLPWSRTAALHPKPWHVKSRLSSKVISTN